MLDIDVKLLNAAELEVEVLRLNVSCEGCRSRRSGENLEAIGNVDGTWSLAEDRGARGGGEGAAASEGEKVGFGVVRRILPQPLSALIPGRIVKDGIAGADCGLLAAAGFPSHAYAGLKSGPVPLDTGVFVRALASDEEGAGGRIEISLTIVHLGNGGSEIPSQTEIHGDVFRKAPIVLDKGPVNFPAAAGGGTLESLVVNGKAGQTSEQVRLGIPGPCAA